MKILFIVPYYKPAYIYGGPVVVISMLAENLVTLGHDVTVYSSSGNGDAELDVIYNKEIFVDGVKVVYFKRITKNNTFLAHGFWSAVLKNATNFDVVHIHTWWNFMALGAAMICKAKGIKPIISPHGMLSDYILKKRHPLSKKLLHALIGKLLLKNSWLHVSTLMELQESKKIIPSWEGRVIPNLVKLPTKEFIRTENETFNIGFLSRIDAKKGLDILIKAASKINVPYKLFVVGSGEEAYVQSLKDLSVECGNQNNIFWEGWKNGDDKFSFLAKMDLFALTSHSENFAIVVIESLSVGTPVLISNNVGLAAYVKEMDFGCVADLDINNIANEINSLILNKTKLNRINLESPVIIKHAYEQVTLTNQYLEYYQSILSA